jgi:DNA-binding NarL/FixJ family response regulator
MNNQQNIRVLIAEDDYLVSEMIKGLLEKTGYTVVGEAADGSEAVEMTQSLRPDVVLMDHAGGDADRLRNDETGSRGQRGRRGGLFGQTAQRTRNA